jgi:hypothetical protein
VVTPYGDGVSMIAYAQPSMTTAGDFGTYTSAFDLGAAAVGCYHELASDLDVFCDWVERLAWSPRLSFGDYLLVRCQLDCDARSLWLTAPLWAMQGRRVRGQAPSSVLMPEWQQRTGEQPELWGWGPAGVWPASEVSSPRAVLCGGLAEPGWRERWWQALIGLCDERGFEVRYGAQVIGAVAHPWSTDRRRHSDDERFREQPVPYAPELKAAGQVHRLERVLWLRDPRDGFWRDRPSPWRLGVLCHEVGHVLCDEQGLAPTAFCELEAAAVELALTRACHWGSRGAFKAHLGHFDGQITPGLWWAAAPRIARAVEVAAAALARPRAS